MSWITCLALGFIVVEGLVVCLFPGVVKAAMEEASPNALIVAGLLESLLAAVLLYVFLVFR